jgi:hypothetical protein
MGRKENSQGQAVEISAEHARPERPEAPGDRGSGAQGKAASGGEDFGDSPGKEAPDKDGPFIQKIALAAQGPLLAILNQLPGKDGKRWIVLPFSLEGLDVCLRILLAGPRIELMGLDIQEGDGDWRFILRPDIPVSRRPGEEPPWSLEVSRSPAPGKGRVKAMERELAGFLGLPPGKLRVRGEELPVFAECRDWTLPSINKEV